MLAWMKTNWLTVATAVVSLLCGVDVAAGLYAGKSLMNVSMLPSLGVGAASVGSIALRWINARSVTTRLIPPGLDAETLRTLEAIFTVSESQDVTDEMAAELSQIAAAAVVGHASRVANARKAAK